MLASIGACGGATICAGDLTVAGSGCACPVNAERRPEYLVLPNGVRDYCIEVSSSATADGGFVEQQDPTVEELPDEPDAGVDGQPHDPGVDIVGDKPARKTSEDPEGGDRTTSVTHGEPAPCVAVAESCNNADDDCDGRTDESGVCTPRNEGTPVAEPADCEKKTWYRDCDADGFAAARGGSIQSCQHPAPLADCSAWTTVVPAGRGTTDCNDRSPVYAPDGDYGPAGDGDGDRNCDGKVERLVERVAVPEAATFAPPATAVLCRDQRSCNCFGWDYAKWQERPPCAKLPGDDFESAYVISKATSEGPAICEPTLTAGSVDAYRLLVSCR
jgi:hypothetical protein